MLDLNLKYYEFRWQFVTVCNWHWENKKSNGSYVPNDATRCMVVTVVTSHGDRNKKFGINRDGDDDRMATAVFTRVTYHYRRRKCKFYRKYQLKYRKPEEIITIKIVLLRFRMRLTSFNTITYFKLWSYLVFFFFVFLSTKNMI